MTDYFIKTPSNFFRIPESRYFRSHATYDVYEFLLDMAYRKEVGAYNDSHIPTKLMADQYRKGNVATFTTVSDIMVYRGHSINTVKEALKKLIKMGLVKTLEADKGKYWDRKGMLYIVGKRLRDKNDKLTKEDESFLVTLSRTQCAYLEGAQKVQSVLISHFKPYESPMPILNLRFDEVDLSVVRQTKKAIAEEKKALSSGEFSVLDQDETYYIDGIAAD